MWPPETLHAFLRLLGAGRPAIAAVESLDQRGIWLRYLPEWGPVRNRPQRNAFHRFTVDRHLLETAAGAAAHQSSVARPDLLLLGALFHDIGKGRGGDHTDVGIGVVQELGPRLGLDPADAAELEQLVRHHLLLPDAATRRDLDDPSTARAVAAAVGTRQTLDLLAVIPKRTAWRPARRLGPVEGGPGGPAGRPGGCTPWRAVPSPTRREVELPPEQTGPARVRPARAPGRRGRLTVAAPDRPGLLAMVAGVLTLSGIMVRSATTLSDPATGMALLRSTWPPPSTTSQTGRPCRRDLDAALDGRLPVDRLLAERESRLLPLPPAPPPPGCPRCGC